MLHHPAAGLARDREGAIGAAGIDDKDLGIERP
jgi:hypothetical protein